MTNRVLFITGEPGQPRPADIPDNWEIYNASRPLYGHKEWQSDFRHGVFYVAINPDGDDADLLRQRTIELDGHLCVWVDKATVEAYGRQVAEKYSRDYNDFKWSDIVKSYAVHFRNETL